VHFAARTDTDGTPTEPIRSELAAGPSKEIIEIKIVTSQIKIDLNRDNLEYDPASQQQNNYSSHQFPTLNSTSLR